MYFRNTLKSEKLKIQILVVEDEALVAAMIREALADTEYNVRTVAFDKASAEKYLQDEHYDAALLDINLDGKHDGIEIGRLIRDKYQMPFLFLTAHADDRTLQNAKLTEPAGYIVKPFTERELKAGLDIALYNFKANRKNAVGVPDFQKLNVFLPEPLSEREIEVLEQIFAGKSNKEIASSLFISINTVKSHLARLYSKFSVNSRTSLLASIREVAERNA